MQKTLDPFRLLLIAVAGWMNQRQQQVINYLREETEYCANRSAVANSDSMTSSVVGWRSGPKRLDGECSPKSPPL